MVADRAVYRQSVISKLKTQRDKNGITISEAAKHLSTSYENARKVLREMVKLNQLVEAPYKDTRGMAIFCLPNDKNVTREFAILAAGDDVFSWMGNRVTREEYLDALEVSAKQEYGESPLTTELTDHSLGLLGYDIDVVEDRVYIEESRGLTKKEKADTKARIAALVQGLGWIRDSYAALLDNPNLWED